MNSDAFKDIEKLETDLWAAADNLRANSKLTSSDYFMPVLGVIFLRHAANRFEAAHQQIVADQASGKMPKRKVLPADYIARRSLYLPATAQYDFIMQQAATSGGDLPRLVTDAMTAIGIDFLIVVVGVFVGLQVSNWNAGRADARLGRVYTERLLVDLHQNRESRQFLVAYYDAVEASAERTVALLAAPDDDRALVIHAYRATEWSGFRDVRATWDEIIFSGNVGLLTPTVVESGLGAYFSYDLSSADLDRLKDSPYRRTVRGTIPHVLQRSIREHCSDVTDDLGISVGFRNDCDLELDDALIAATARALRADATLIEELRNQFSEFGIAQLTLLGDIVLLDRVIAALEGRDPEEAPEELTP